jgi:DNA polymerase I
MARAILRRELPTRDVTSLVRLTKTPEQYLATRAERRELAYEALLTAGREQWTPGDRIRVYRALSGRAGLVGRHDRDDPRDYDVDVYVRLLRDTFAARLASALAPNDFAAAFADPEQPSLFEAELEKARPILTTFGFTAP